MKMVTVQLYEKIYSLIIYVSLIPKGEQHCCGAVCIGTANLIGDFTT